MKYIKKLLIFFMMFFYFVNTGFANEKESKNKVLQLNQGQGYINIIDSFIQSNSKNHKKLLLIQEKLIIITKSYSENKYISIFEYLEYRVNYSITIINEDGELVNDIQNNIIEDIKKDEIIDNNKGKQDNIILFPGFSKYYNDQDKNILAGTEVEIYSSDINARLEEIEIGKVIVYINTDTPDKLKNTIDKAKIYLEGTLINIANSSDISSVSNSQIKIKFDKMEDFILTKNEREYRVSIITNSIGEDEVGETIDNFYISRVGFDDVTGLVTGDNLNNISFNNKGENNTILPVELSIKQDEIISLNTISFNISGNYGNNFEQSGAQNRLAELEKFTFRPYGGSDLDEYSYTFINIDNPSEEITGVFNNGLLEFTLDGLGSSLKTINDSIKGENFEIYIAHPTRKDTINLNLQRDGISFTLLNQVGKYTSKFEKTIDFISKTN